MIYDKKGFGFHLKKIEVGSNSAALHSFNGTYKKSTHFPSLKNSLTVVL